MRARALARSGLDPEDVADPERLLDIEKVVALAEAAARETGDPCFGLHAGLHWPFGALGVLSYVVLNAPTVGTALRNLDRYGRFQLQAGRMGCDVRGREALLYYEVSGIAPDRCRQHVESAVAVGLRLMRHLAGADWRPVRVELAHPAPRSAVEHERVFGAHVTFGHRRSGLWLDAAVLGRPVPAADRSILPVVERHLDELLAARAADPFVGQVRGAIAESLCDGSPSIQALAKRMAMSVRTFQRRLDERGLAFRDLVAEIRQELAQRYLAESTTNLTEVAFLLGYSELSAFDRAFRRWTGSTPLATRRRLRTNPAA